MNKTTTPGKAAAMVGVRPETFRRWIKLGLVRAIRVGTRFRVPLDELERLIGASSIAGIPVRGEGDSLVVASTEAA